MTANSRAFLFASITALSAAGALAQGSLTPPTGPAPSMKSLGQIEPRVIIEKAPFKIAAAGSYYLATNLFVGTGLNGISIDAENVTLDLNGFTITGAADSAAAVSVVPGRNNITVRNGAIAAVGSGIEASSATQVKVDSIRVSKCAEVGVSVGAGSAVQNSSFAGNGAAGVHAGVGTVISQCQANNNGGNGFETEAKCTVRDSNASANALAGIFVGDFSKVLNVSATDNLGFGITGGAAVHLTDCTATSNKQHGLNVGRLSFVTRANSSWNGYNGISADDGVSIIDSSTSANAVAGILAGNTAHIANCKADSNAGGGIVVQKGSTVRDCSAQHNTSDGITVTDQCIVSRNHANTNSNLKGAAGIRVKGTDNVIQENAVTANDRGISLEAEGNLVVKNTATNNTLNFFTVGDQMMGPVVSTFENADPINPMSNFVY